jgi:hypothetical protein
VRWDKFLQTADIPDDDDAFKPEELPSRPNTANAGPTASAAMSLITVVPARPRSRGVDSETVNAVGITRSWGSVEDVGDAGSKSPTAPGTHDGPYQSSAKAHRNGSRNSRGGRIAPAPPESLAPSSAQAWPPKPRRSKARSERSKAVIFPKEIVFDISDEV